jgi:hypothetical protein
MIPINNLQNEDMDRYIPGTCNIGKEEVKKRRNGMVFAAVLAIIIVAVLLFTHADKLWRFFIFFPLVSFAVGFQQTIFKFCVGFGLKGIFNFKDLGESITVEEAEMRRLDKAKATKMIVTGILFGLVLTVLFYFIP